MFEYFELSLPQKLSKVVHELHGKRQTGMICVLIVWVEIEAYFL